jgi:glycolate oxidase FAD binding subunit
MSDTFVREMSERIRDAAARKAPLRIRAGGTKDFYGGVPSGDVLDVSANVGIVAYEPKELVLTVRAGTPLAELERVLGAERQMLAFEPPRFGAGSTIGGTVAAGFSGPRRPYAGAARDFVLGARIVNGKGEDLSFGGRVIKNVAGYDVSRLMAGALGTLGVLAEISFKVLPRPVREVTLGFQMDEAAATRQVNAWAGQPLPLSGTAWLAGRLLVRLSGAESAVNAARAKIGGEEATDLPGFWEALRDQRIEFFENPRALWRVSVPQTAAPIPTPHHQLIEWGGGQRWIAGDMDAAELRSAAQKAGGHATLYRRGDKSVGVFHPLQPAIMKIHRRLKDAFDPAGILNPGRMYTFGALGPLSGPSREDQKHGG